MKTKVIIEEVITQKFEVDVTDEHSAYKEIREKYKKGELVIENPTLVEASVLIGEDEDWIDLHI